MEEDDARQREARWVGGHRLHRRYGHQVIDSAYAPVAGEQAVIARMASARDEGRTYRAIAADLNGAGIAPPAGTEWFPATIRRVLRREALSA